ncbi:hypothetical protein LB505_008933 [Fusarium chuoi]|nr:hypothetical protein LB505_008933 [Fusarium chuoi]
MLFAISLAEKLGSRGLQAFSLHPGAILGTSLAKHLDTLDSLEHNGAYLLECRLADPMTDTVRPWATSSTEAELLWRNSEEMVGQKFDF